MTENTKSDSQLDFKHDPSLFNFLINYFSFKDSASIPIEIDASEQAFLEDVAYGTDKLCKRFRGRQTGGTVLMCMLALYFHLKDKTVLFFSQNTMQGSHVVDTMMSLKVEHFDMIQHTKRRIYLSDGIDHPTQVRPIHFHDTFDKQRVSCAIKGLSVDYVFCDNIRHDKIEDIWNIVVPNMYTSGGKMIVNVSP